MSTPLLSKATTIPTSLLGLLGGLSYFGALESSSLIFGMDPLIVYGAATAGCMGEHYVRTMRRSVTEDEASLQVSAG